jgi:glutathione S-transferase
VLWLGFVTIAALIEYMVLGLMVGRARMKYRVAAPATTGHPIFERYFRVHQNTLEVLVVFIPGLWLFAHYVNAGAAVALGIAFVASRIFYAVGYLQDPERRTAGAIATMLINTVLVAGSLIGVIWHAL